MGKPVVHFEIGTKNPELMERFYGQLFGWSMSGGPNGYRMIHTGSETGVGGGVMTMPNGAPPYLAIYVQVDDLPALLRHAEQLGGQIVVPPTDLPNGRRFAMITDPEHHVVGLLSVVSGGEPATEVATPT